MKIKKAATLVDSDAGRTLFDLLRREQDGEPFGIGSDVPISSLLKMPTHELRAFFHGLRDEAIAGDAWQIRGWYHQLYRDVFRGRRVLGIGSSIDMDALHFIEHGAVWHFADIIRSNLELMGKLVDAYGFSHGGSTYVEDLTSFENVPRDFDFIYCGGALTRVPFDFARHEAMVLIRHLKPGGRWVEFSYPRKSSASYGVLSFLQWRNGTQDEGKLGAEWYDLKRIRKRFSPISVRPLLACNFPEGSYSWYDLAVDHLPDELFSRSSLKTPFKARRPRRIKIVMPGRRFHSTPNATLFHGASATIRGDTPTITTGPKTWFNTCQVTIPVDPDGSHDSDATCLVLDLDVVVHQGCVGVGLLADDLRQYIDREWELRAKTPAHHVELRSLPGQSTLQLMFRNAQGNDAPSRFSITNVTVRSAPAAAPAQPVIEEVDSARAIALSALVQRYSPEIETDDGKKSLLPTNGDIPVFVEIVDIANLGAALGFNEPSAEIPVDFSVRYTDRKMETEDAPILAYLYRNHSPLRHLEFGTWQGFGAVLCAQNCNAEIWTLNLPQGETASDNRKMYVRPRQTSEDFVEGVGAVDAQPDSEQTDSGAYIGWKYREAGLGHRVHQILADSVKWNIDEFRPGFFDSVLIDGGHQAAVVTNDTEKALLLLRSGGLMMWHDFCPADSTMRHFSACRGVVSSIHTNWQRWSSQFAKLFWIRPSFLLVGIKR